MGGANPERTNPQLPSRPATPQHERAGQVAHDDTSVKHLRRRTALDTEAPASWSSGLFTAATTPDQLTRPGRRPRRAGRVCKLVGTEASQQVRSWPRMTSA